MFLKKLWAHNKLIFCLLAIYFVLLIFFNYKRGAVATPLYQYGMFSGKYHISDTQFTYHIYVNGQLLNIAGYSFVDIDMMIASLDNYQLQKQNNPIIYAGMKRLFNKIGLGRFMDEQVYNNTITDIQFTQWYKNLIEKITGFKVITLQVFKQKYQYINNCLQPVSPPLKQTFIVTE